ncbi:MAG: BspA family leucine-rich repeat surface protein [Lactobacillaceae bacterium]|jgi:surface protein|nr:BspA family leucine-rich repeat surface protein [Lactobacillaceae bacterium]
MIGLKLTKRLAQALALLAVVVGGAVTPAASIIIPGIESVAQAAITAENDFGNCHWVLDDGVLTISPKPATDGVLGASRGNWLALYGQLITKIVIAPGVVANPDSSNLFSAHTKLITIEGGDNLDTSEMTKMEQMFKGCSNLVSIDVSNWDTSNVYDMFNVFEDCSSLEELDVSVWDTSNVQWLGRTFYNCSSLEELDVSEWDVGSVTLINALFQNCVNLKVLNVANWHPAKITQAVFMFSGCSSLEELDLSQWHTTEALTTGGIFADCSSLWKLTLGGDFKFQPSVNAAIPIPVEGTTFNGNDTVASALWREIGTGTPKNPSGAQVSAADIETMHNASNKTETYVWQWLSDTIVDYTVEPAYTIIIPTSITIATTTGKGTGNVILGAYPKLPYNERFITISVDSSNWKLKNTNDSGVAYLFGKTDGGRELSDGGSFTFTADGEKSTDTVQQVYATLPAGSQDDFKYAGVYSDTVNYTIRTGDSAA